MRKRMRFFLVAFQILSINFELTIVYASCQILFRLCHTCLYAPTVKEGALCADGPTHAHYTKSQSPALQGACTLTEKVGPF